MRKSNHAKEELSKEKIKEVEEEHLINPVISDHLTEELWERARRMLVSHFFLNN
jgi:phosphoribosylformylglycinamidine (FGAM) synthase PurS component